MELYQEYASNGTFVMYPIEDPVRILDEIKKIRDEITPRVDDTDYLGDAE